MPRARNAGVAGEFLFMRVMEGDCIDLIPSATTASGRAGVGAGVDGEFLVFRVTEGD